MWQEVVDALSFELPKAVSKFAGISRKFLDMAIGIIDQFIVKCGPRDMLSILCNVSLCLYLRLTAYFSPSKIYTRSR